MYLEIQNLIQIQEMYLSSTEEILYFSPILEDIYAI